MQSILHKNNSNHFNIYKLLIKLLPLLIGCFSVACNEQKERPQILSAENQISVSKSAININTASAEELEKLPHVGEKLAQNIIEHRQRFGKFRKPEHLLFIRGISDEKFREVRSFVKVE